MTIYIFYIVSILVLLLLCGCYCGGYTSNYWDVPVSNYPPAKMGVYGSGLYYDSEWYDRVVYGE